MIWQPIETAPSNTPVLVKVGEGMSFIARLLPGNAINDAGDTCDQWCAEYEGEHPACWSEGACWEINEDERCSLQPTHWMPPPPTTGRGIMAKTKRRLAAQFKRLSDKDRLSWKGIFYGTIADLYRQEIRLLGEEPHA